MTPEQFRGFGFPGADDLGNMFQFKADFEDDYCGARPIDVSRKLNPELQDFAAFLARNASPHSARLRAQVFAPRRRLPHGRLGYTLRSLI